MRFIVSIVGFVLFIVGCQQLVPTSYKYGTLPTHEYGQTDKRAGPEVREASDVLRSLRSLCLQHGGVFTLRHSRNTEATCTLESN